VNARGDKLVIPGYLLSVRDGPPFGNRRITRQTFYDRPIGLAPPQSKTTPLLYVVARLPTAEGTWPPRTLWERSPNQTAQIALSAAGFTVGVEFKHDKAGCSYVAQRIRSSSLPQSPATLSMFGSKPILSYVKVHGVFPLSAGMSHLHENYSFNESLVETVVQSVRL